MSDAGLATSSTTATSTLPGCVYSENTDLAGSDVLASPYSGFGTPDSCCIFCGHLLAGVNAYAYQPSAGYCWCKIISGSPYPRVDRTFGWINGGWQFFDLSLLSAVYRIKNLCSSIVGILLLLRSYLVYQTCSVSVWSLSSLCEMIPAYHLRIIEIDDLSSASNRAFHVYRLFADHGRCCCRNNWSDYRWRQRWPYDQHERPRIDGLLLEQSQSAGRLRIQPDRSGGQLQLVWVRATPIKFVRLGSSSHSKRMPILQ